MQRAERLIEMVRSGIRPAKVDDPPLWQVEKTRFQANLCRVLLLPLGGVLILLMKHLRGYRIENMRAIREEFRRIWSDKQRSGRPLLICANHLTFVDSAIIIWALASNWWYVFNYKSFAWNLPAGDFFKKKLHYHAVLYLTKCIFIDRKGTAAHKNDVLNLCRYLLAKGNVVLIFPEGQRSREGHFVADRLRFGTGKIIASLGNADVLCVYLRSPQQDVFSNYPPKNSHFTMKMKLITPSVEGTSKKQASISAVKELGAAIEQMENEFFTEQSLAEARTK